MIKNNFVSPISAMEIKQLVTDILNKYHWSQKDLAKILKMDESRISRWVTGYHKPQKSKLRRLYELKEHGLTPVVNDSTRIDLPILSNIPKTGAIQEQNILGYCSYPKWLFDVDSKDCYIVQLDTDDLRPKFNKGDFLVISPVVCYSLGDIVIMTIDDKLRSEIMTIDIMTKTKNANLIGVVAGSIKTKREVY